MNGNDDMAARQQIAANALGGLGAAAAPREPTNIGTAINKSERINDCIRNCHDVVSQIFDKISGPRPEKEATLGQDCPAGQLSQLHSLLDQNGRGLEALLKRLAELNETL